MKLKPLPLIAAAITLAVTAIPFAAQAQMRSFSPLQMAQMSKPGGGEKGGRGFGRLNLTDAQKAQMQTIKTNTRAQIEGILTAEQKATLQAAKEARQAQRQAGQGQRQARRGQRGEKGFANLNLSEEQKTQMRQIREASKEQMLAVLTPEQRQQMAEMRQNMESRRQQRNSQ
ncbi:P pilus assembly/Cpx signaling pathway, periplasmic inhibitor/zinc-resistance associated protein [Nodularia harveyana UHCC-0300]|uniref:P pilus assembly/Cpx signaling pathway, periplasmic inhibitor/zinc-resistance associated protein n=1 Tax=Nodularia harveyana UHCC-0300 TaxID=2974287 RepID=A0ABU5UHN3_9CYAN|nr:P pilus assembly/Cpx signaling pathway, periplasmic inhibitor/zinc-resistance associated protein [Nodularia harveyana]MEA5582615.1 P pilus assembly/Cpx signaling pathway, periplasmic inhibitor/zinc-resistance associated protein [Nodularia harveyana UHCC-0300]